MASACAGTACPRSSASGCGNARSPEQLSAGRPACPARRPDGTRAQAARKVCQTGAVMEILIIIVALVVVFAAAGSLLLVRSRRGGARPAGQIAVRVRLGAAQPACPRWPG